MISQQKNIVEKGKNIFYRIKSRLEKQYSPGNYVTIEVSSGKYFVGDTPVEAINKAKKSFPHKQFFLTQVGRVAGILK